MDAARRQEAQPQLVALWGDEHPHLGEVVTAGIGEHAAIALSAGRLPKPYWHLDPNEDAVLAAEGGQVRLLAVADGHNGFDAARAALRAVATTWEALLGDPSPTAIVVDLMDVARNAVIDAVADLEPPRGESRTALTVAVVTPTHVHTATWGDTAAALIRRSGLWGRPRSARVDRDGPFLGPGAVLPPVASSRVRAGDVVVVASDGLIDHLPRRWDDRVAATMAESDSLAHGVRRAVDQALLAGAGDHVSLAAAAV